VSMLNEIGLGEKIVSKKTGLGKTIVIAIVVLLFLTIFRPWKSIAAGHVGVITHFGKVDTEVLTEGIHLRVPIYTTITEMNTQIQKIEVEASAASKDLQTVHSVVAVNTHINPASAAIIFQQIGIKYEATVIQPAIQESVKAVTAGYTAEELISKRQEVASQIQDILSAKLKDYHIVIDKFNIINFSFSDSFNAAVEAKQEAEQKALKAKQDLTRIEVEAQQKIATAKAEAEALKVQKQEITPELLELRKIEVQSKAVDKWNGVNSTTVLGDGDSIMPLINIK